MTTVLAPPHTSPLPSGETVTVDAADRTLVEAAGPWRALRLPHTTYVRANLRRPDGSWTGVYLHRLLVDPTDDEQVDHVNRDGLDNRRINLRVCTRSQNRANSPVRVGGSSEFKGVCWDKGAAKWRASGCDGAGKIRYLGLFTDEHEAALAYDAHALAMWGEFAWLNRDHFGKVPNAR